jgi:hypothetical protein
MAIQLLQDWISPSRSSYRAGRRRFLVQGNPGQARYFLFSPSIIDGSGSSFERQRGGAPDLRRFPRTAALAGLQALLGALFQPPRELGSSQRTSRLRGPPKGVELRLGFSLLQELPPTGRGPALAPRGHFQASVRIRHTAMRGGAGPPPPRRLRRQSRPHRIQLRVAQRRPEKKLEISCLSRFPSADGGLAP